MTAKNLFITGASTGIGAATARLAAADGWNVAIGYLSSKDAAEAVAADVRAAGREAMIVPGDVGDPDAIPAMFKAVDAMGPLTGFVNNAGIVGMTQRVEDYTAERVARIMAVNVTGSILCASQAVRRMSTKHGGHGGSIVNISSAAAYIGSPNQYVDYAASKAAIDTFTKGLALEVGQEGIRVNAVRPGLIDTELHAKGGEPGRAERLAHMVPMGRSGSAMEVAQGIVWLLSDGASYVTSTTLDVTGGR
ncbi:SDR family oxidoreductase [Pseudaestuariivita atlantica]|uniref:Sugar dehydrogenase n=1 Tax=Pseudaestuariivita atlantica TaxID=1317121 RepID=A0A0L1JTJ4_9RHOB|nr:SDR family oxidoreductase [Pseudaestuariivita atlantica]KNG95094.1 sugar dehydrogenase [Pseudaestuariivita atlantica]